MRNQRKNENIKVLSSYSTGSSLNIEGEDFTSDEAALLGEVQARYGLPMWVTAKLLRDAQGRQARWPSSFDQRFHMVESKLRVSADTIEAARMMVLARLDGN